MKVAAVKSWNQGLLLRIGVILCFTAVITAVSFGLSVGADDGRGRTVVFPEEAVINIAKQYGARGDGKTDDTAAIQQALDHYANASKILYLPEGTYLLSDTLKWGSGTHGGMAQKRTVLQGAGIDRTILRLRDRASGFQTTPKAVIWTGEKPAQRFRNGLRDLTVSIGSGNPSAVGIQYIANNQGTVQYVKITSADKTSGSIGLDLGYTDEQGPCLIRHVTVEGFEVGISMKHVVDSVTLECISCTGQRRAAVVNDGQCVSMRRFRSRNTVPAVINSGFNSFLVLTDAHLEGGDSHEAALLNSGYALLRNIQTGGYAAAVRQTDRNGAVKELPPDTAVREWRSHEAYTLFPANEETLGLTVRETPEAPLHPLSQWVSPTEFGGNPNDDGDDSAAVQRAIDSGKKVVYFPYGKWIIDGTVEIRGAVEVFTFQENGPQGGGTIRIADGDAKTVFFERINFLYKPINLEIAAARDVVIRSVTWGTGRIVLNGTGTLFLEDTCLCDLTIPKGLSVYARQLNIEHSGGCKLLNDGGLLWILGLKTEKQGTICQTRRGGKTEILGGLVYAQGDPKDSPMFIVDNAEMTASVGEVCWNFAQQGYHTLARETRGNETRELPGGSQAGRLWHANDASMVLLYAAGNSRTP
jgi:hypothetical protein